MENRKCSFVLGMHTASCGVGVRSQNQRVSCVKREMQIVGGPREPRFTCIVESNLMCQAAKGERSRIMALMSHPNPSQHFYAKNFNIVSVAALTEA